MAQSRQPYETPTITIHDIHLGVFGCYNGADIEFNMPVADKPTGRGDLIGKLD